MTINIAFHTVRVTQLTHNNVSASHRLRRDVMMSQPQLAFYVNLHRAVIGPSATLTGRRRPDIDLRRMLTGTRGLNDVI